MPVLRSRAWRRNPRKRKRASGKKYGARDPKTCSNRKAPGRGALSPAQAIQYFTCDAESEWDLCLYLVTDVKIEVAPNARPFNRSTDGLVNSEIDPSQPVYNIRGSFRQYQCNYPGAVNGAPGKNCAIYEQAHASGTCYKDTFGDWHWRMTGVDAGVDHATATSRPRSKAAEYRVRPACWRRFTSRSS